MVENSGTKFFYVQLSKMERVQDKRNIKNNLGGNNRNNAPECPECKSPLIPVSSLKSVGPTFWECTICGIYCKKEIRETKQLSNEVESISNGQSDFSPWFLATPDGPN